MGNATANTTEHHYDTYVQYEFVSLSQSTLLARCLIYAWALPARPYNMQLSIVWVRSFIEPDLFDNNVPFDNTSPIYLINLLWKSGLELGLDLELHYFNIFHFSRIITKTSTLSSANFTEGNILLKERIQTINNKIKLHILGVPMNKLGNLLISDALISLFRYRYDIDTILTKYRYLVRVRVI